MDFDLRHLRAYLAVCEELNFHRAARRIGIAQPAVSRAVTDLERRLGARLLERSTRAVTLTEAGRGFQDDARALLAEAGRMAHNARLTAGGTRGRLRVAYVEFAAQRLLPAVVLRFQASEPDIALEFRAMSSERQRRALGERDIDVGFMLGPYGGSGLASAGVAEEPLVALLPRAHALARLDRVSWRQVAALPLIVGDMAGWGAFRRLLENPAAGHGGLSATLREVPTTALALALVGEGLGAGFYAGTPARYELRDVAVRRVGPVTAPVQTCMVWPRERQPIVSRLVRVASQVAQEQAVEQVGEPGDMRPSDS